MLGSNCAGTVQVRINEYSHETGPEVNIMRPAMPLWVLCMDH